MVGVAASTKIAASPAVYSRRTRLHADAASVFSGSLRDLQKDVREELSIVEVASMILSECRTDGSNRKAESWRLGARRVCGRERRHASTLSNLLWQNMLALHWHTLLWCVFLSWCNGRMVMFASSKIKYLECLPRLSLQLRCIYMSYCFTDGQLLKCEYRVGEGMRQ